MRSKLESYFGFARKSGNLATGYDTCIQLMKRKKIKLLIVAEDASEKTKEKFLRLAEMNHVEIHVFGKTEELSAMAGLENRSIFGLTDGNFAKAIVKEIEIMRD